MVHTQHSHGVSQTLGLEIFPFTGLVVFSLNALLVKTQWPEKLKSLNLQTLTELLSAFCTVVLTLSLPDHPHASNECTDTLSLADQ